MITSASALAERPQDHRLLILDCRFDLDEPARGEREYAAGHIPGAVYVHLDRDLSGQKTGRNGRHPLPTIEEMAQRFGNLGIAEGTCVVAYDSDTCAYASRAWWMLRYLGHDDVEVLDGGFTRWAAEGRPVRRGIETRQPRAFTPRVRHEMLVTVDELVARLDEPGHVLIDARSPERYRGEVEPIDRVPGHIPGAVNRHYQKNLGPDGRFRPAEELRAELAPLADARLAPAAARPSFDSARDNPERSRRVGDARAEHVIVYCGSGVTACHNLLALELAGIRGARLYAGSWSEWSADPERPVEQGSGGRA
jgi:thiosulfate/3-mercaptopyruvate sulfurtransferase